MRKLRIALAVGLLLGFGVASPAASDAPAASPAALLDRLEAVWAARDAEGYLALFEFEGPEGREAEAEAIRDVFGAEDTRLTLQRPSPAAAGTADARVFSSREPRAQVQEWRFRFARRGEHFAFVARDEVGRVDGLVHLSLDPQGFRADGLLLQLEDFELKMHRGTIFASPPDLGPTVLVFVGEGEVKVRPRPLAEREQLRQFCGTPDLVENVSAAFVRIHPADLHRVLLPALLVPDPAGARRLPAAQRFYREQAEKAYVLDTSLPRSPWWLMPSVGDGTVTFQTARRGTLTFGVTTSDAEDLSLFDRKRRLQICAYPSKGRPTRYSEDDGRAVDVLSHDLRVSFDPATSTLSGEDTLRVRVLVPVSTIRLRLHDAFRVLAVTSTEGTSHLFFRVRNQGSLVVSLGPYAGSLGEVSFTIRYAGIHDAAAPIDQETIQIEPPLLPEATNDEAFIERVQVYTNRTAWYPRGPNDDHATARLRLETPPGFLAISGGELVRSGTEGGRSFAEYRQDEPGKYITAVVGRFSGLGLRQEGRLAVRGFGLPRTRDVAQGLMLQTEKIVAFLTERFGPCPYTHLNLALIEGKTPGGHSPPGMIIIQQRPPLIAGRTQLRDDPASFSEIPGFFLAHELTHQWWGQGVAPENYHERWLAEAWAQYAAALWVRQSRGEGPFRGILDRFAYWSWRHTAAGPIRLGNRLGHLRGDSQIYRAIVYDKGAYVIHMLRAIVGEEAFVRATRDFQEQHRFGKAGTDDLREALEKASGKNLSAYFDAWIDGTALPVLRYAWRTEPLAGRYRTLVEVKARDLPGPVPLKIAVWTDTGRQEQTVSLSPEGGRFTVATALPPRKVEINDDRALLARVEEGS